MEIEETHCRNYIGYFFRLAARDFLYVGTINSSMGPPSGIHPTTHCSNLENDAFLENDQLKSMVDGQHEVNSSNQSTITPIVDPNTEIQLLGIAGFCLVQV